MSYMFGVGSLWKHNFFNQWHQEKALQVHSQLPIIGIYTDAA